MIDVPKVYITPVALEKMNVIVEISSKEVGWLGTARQLRTGDFLIDDVYLFDQEVSYAQCEMSTEGLEAFAVELLEQPDGDELYDNLRVWGHSHVNMGTSPSAQDNSQMDLFRENGCEWFIRIIANKAGRLEVTVFMYRNHLVIEDAEWRVAVPGMDEIRAQIEAEFTAKVRETKFTGVQVWRGGCWQGGDFDLDDRVEVAIGMTVDELHVYYGFDGLKGSPLVDEEIAMIIEDIRYDPLYRGLSDVDLYSKISSGTLPKAQMKPAKSYRKPPRVVKRTKGVNCAN